MDKKYILLFCLLTLMNAGTIAQAQELTAEELEIIENLEMLENMDLLEEDLALLEDFEDIENDDLEIGDDDA